MDVEACKSVQYCIVSDPSATSNFLFTHMIIIQKWWQEIIYYKTNHKE